jgi:type I restriction enzyme S subunit
VPEHWEVQRSKWLFRNQKEINADRANSNVLSLTLRGVVNNDPDNPEGLVPKDYATYQIFRKGDLVFKLIDLENLNTSRVGLVHEDGIMSSAYVRLIPQSAGDVRFFFRQYFDLYERGIYNQLGAGVRSTLGAVDLLNVSLVVPSLLEQSAIVRFIDQVDQRIRNYLRAKQKLIKLLEEEKQAIVHRAVTRGLDPSVQLKPSGIEWLGDVPGHWELVLNQRIFKEEIRPHGGLPETQLSLSQRDGLIATSDMRERSLQTSSFDNWKVTIPGDLVLNRFKAHLGVFFASTLRGIVSFHYGVFMPRRRLVTKYFEFLYHTSPYRAIYAGRSNGMTVGLQNLSNQNFYNVRSIIPPFREQEEIVGFIEKTTEQIDVSIEHARRQSELIREYRKRLIADVVTGKLDVREAAAKLPEELAETEPLDEIDDVLHDDVAADADEAEAIEEA